MKKILYIATLNQKISWLEKENDQTCFISLITGYHEDLQIVKQNNILNFQKIQVLSEQSVTVVKVLI